MLIFYISLVRILLNDPLLPRENAVEDKDGSWTRGSLWTTQSSRWHRILGTDSGHFSALRNNSYSINRSLPSRSFS